jgi:hypothetical protein
VPALKMGFSPVFLDKFEGMICDHEKTRPPGLPAFGFEHPSGIQPAAGGRTPTPGIDYPAGFFGVGIRAGWRKGPQLPQRGCAGGLAKKTLFCSKKGASGRWKHSWAGSAVWIKIHPGRSTWTLFFSIINYWIQLSGTTPSGRSRCPKSCRLIFWSWTGLLKQPLPDWQPPTLSG